MITKDKNSTNPYMPTRYVETVEEIIGEPEVKKPELNEEAWYAKEKSIAQGEFAEFCSQDAKGIVTLKNGEFFCTVQNPQWVKMKLAQKDDKFITEVDSLQP